MSGIARGKILPAEKFLRILRERGLRMPEAIFIQTVTGEYPDDEDVTSPANSDIYMRPDANTIRLVPWYTEATAQVISDCDLCRRQPGRYLAALGAEAGAGAVRRARLAADRGARAGVLPGPGQQGPGLSPGAAGRPLGADGERPAGLRHRRGQRVRPDLRGCLRLLRGPADRHRHADPRGRRRPDRDQLQPRRSAGTGRPGLPVQAHRPRNRDAPQRLRDIHGEAHAGRAGQRHAPPSERGGQGHRQEPVLDRGRRGHAPVPQPHRRPAEVPAVGDAAAGAQRQFLSPADRRVGCADQRPLGPRQPHHRLPRAGVAARVAPCREPRGRGRRQPLSGAGGSSPAAISA